MITLTLVNQSKVPMPKAFLKAWIKDLDVSLRECNVQFPDAPELSIVFMDVREAKALNKKYRGKDYATDVLSFGSEDNLGDLVICPQVLKKQAKEHDLTFQDELGYMVIHGLLHLLGFDHERTKKEAALMFKLQDAVFDRLLSLREDD